MPTPRQPDPSPRWREGERQLILLIPRILCVLAPGPEERAEHVEQDFLADVLRHVGFEATRAS